MTRPSLLLPWFAGLLLLSSCSLPPKPPTVDESTRRPVNSAMAVDLQTCRSDLENTRIVATDSARGAEATAQAMARIAQQQLLARSIEASATAQRNRLFTVLFAFGSTEVALPDADAARILDEVRAAPLIVLRGRTDGAIESRAESAIARRRADAVQTWLVHSGVDRARIRTTWQPVGDHAADNGTPQGRSLNRRVEIEVYRTPPLAMATSPAVIAPQ